MNESKTTIIFVGVAALMALSAFASHYLNQPSNSADFEMVGKPFFEDFTSASQAQSLEVAAVDAESGLLKRFSVENQNGLWRIPSHYNYPAEAAARLATTATSVMGIERASLAGRLAKEHERLGVLDPLADEIEDPEGVGQRITLKDKAGDVVVDYIIGKVAGDVVLSEAEQPFGNNGKEKYYFVRRPDEQQTYKVKLDIDLSTRFSDWIDPDLLRVDSNQVTKILIDNYTLEEERSNPLVPTKALFKAQGDNLELSRNSNTESWELAGLNAEDEELQTSRINEMLEVVDQMKIAGVRPKYKYKNHLLLTADLELNRQPEFEKDPQEFGRAINRLQNELDQKGFNLAGSAQKMELVAQHGDLEIGTEQGVVYTLHVGKAFDGDEEAIEIGAPDSKSDSESKTESETESTSQQTDPANTDGENSADENKTDSPDSDDAKEEFKNRYLMIRVAFDESLIVPKPVEPQEPVAPIEPDGYTPPVDPSETDAVADANADEDAVEKPPADDKPDRDPEFVKYDEAVVAFHDLKLDFELAKTRFKTESSAYEKKIVEGKKLVSELNERFSDWYYVITGENLSTLQTKRTDLVTKIEKPPGEEDTVTPRPDISFPDLPKSPGDSEKGTGNVDSDTDKSEADESVLDEAEAEIKDSDKQEVKKTGSTGDESRPDEPPNANDNNGSEGDERD